VAWEEQAKLLGRRIERSSSCPLGEPNYVTRYKKEKKDGKPERAKPTKRKRSLKRQETTGRRGGSTEYSQDMNVVNNTSDNVKTAPRRRHRRYLLEKQKHPRQRRERKGSEGIHPFESKTRQGADVDFLNPSSLEEIVGTRHVASHKPITDDKEGQTIEEGDAQETPVHHRHRLGKKSWRSHSQGGTVKEKGEGSRAWCFVGVSGASEGGRAKKKPWRGEKQSLKRRTHEAAPLFFSHRERRRAASQYAGGTGKRTLRR